MAWIQRALVVSLALLIIAQWLLNFYNFPYDQQMSAWIDKISREGFSISPLQDEGASGEVGEVDGGFGGDAENSGYDDDGVSGEAATTFDESIPTNLEFVHITKTAGSAIEQQGASAGLKWGVCHWKNVPIWGFPACEKKDTYWGKFRGKFWQLYNRQEIPIKFNGMFGEPWHTPPHWIKRGVNPFENSTTFAVVRNPYDRAISEYYSKFGGYKGRDKNNATVMNAWMHKRMAPGRRKTPHFLPQHYYVFDKRGNRVINHVLRYETLDDDFRKLMDMYNLNVSLPGRENARHRNSSLTTANLTWETIELMNKYFADDFRRLNYSMMQFS